MTSENGNGLFNMPVMPAYGGGYGGGGGFGNSFGGDGWWIILLLLLAGNGMWGGFGGMGGMMWPMMMGGMGGGFGLDYLYPWLNNSQHISDGFRDQNLQTSINGLQNSVTSGFGDVQNSLCSGFAGVNAGIANGFAQAEIANNSRQIANMQQNFAAQTATLQGFNGVQSQLAQCCCDNRQATNDLKYVIAQENCLDRQAISDGIRDLLTAQTAGFQGIKDLLYQDRLDEKQDRIASLERQLTAAQLNASQIAQTAQIVDQTYNRLSQCPVGTVPVFGEQAIFRCNNNNGGCGCNGGFAN